jgi:hypothetical protein
MSLKLNSSGGGSVLLQEPSTASNRTLTLPDATTTAVGTDATQTLSNKTFSGAQTFGTASFAEPSGSAPLFAARAWVNFNGTGTVAIRASGNVSSITDNTTGDYTVNFTTAMPDANYSVVGMSMRDSTNASNLSVLGSATYNTISTTNVRVNNRDDANNQIDALAVCVSIFR